MATLQQKKTNERDCKVLKPNERGGGSTQTRLENTSHNDIRSTKFEKEPYRQGTKSKDYKGFKIIQGEKMEHDR